MAGPATQPGYVEVRDVSGESYDDRGAGLGVHGGVRRGWGAAAIGGATRASDIFELHVDGSFSIATEAGTFGLIGGYLFSQHELSGGQKFGGGGFDLRLSYAPIRMLSLEVSHSWLGGALEGPVVDPDVGGSRWAGAVTLLMFGIGIFNFGVELAAQHVSVSPHGLTDDGFTFELVSTVL